MDLNFCLLLDLGADRYLLRVLGTLLEWLSALCECLDVDLLGDLCGCRVFDTLDIVRIRPLLVLFDLLDPFFCLLFDLDSGLYRECLEVCLLGDLSGFGPFFFASLLPGCMVWQLDCWRARLVDLSMDVLASAWDGLVSSCMFAWGLLVDVDLLELEEVDDEHLEARGLPLF